MYLTFLNANADSKGKKGEPSKESNGWKIEILGVNHISNIYNRCRIYVFFMDEKVIIITLTKSFEVINELNLFSV